MTRRFDASPERVFDAWTNPEKVARWMSTASELGAPGTSVRVEMDPRIGGRFSFVDRRDGEEIDHIGEYLEMEPPRRLAFTWTIPQYSPDSDRISIEIVPRESGCEVFLVCEMDPAWASYAERTRHAWTLMLDAIARIVE